MQKDQQKLEQLIKGKKVAFIGAGVSHKTLIKEFVELGAHVTLCDQKKSVEDFGDYAATIRELGIDLSLGENYLDGFKGQDIIMRTPGFVGYFEKPLQDAMAAGTMVTSEVELFFDFCPCEIVAVTGSDGKTTTTTLIGEIFKNFGKTAYVVGNIGYPYSAAGLDSQDDDLFVCEVSSFQMETAETFHPKAAALLNITEDHLNRHGTMEVYTAMKMRQFQNMTAEDVAVFNADDPALAPLIGQVKAQVMLFSRKREVDQGAFVRDGEIVVRFHGAEEMICPVKDVFIPGPHNLENALAACCIAVAMGVKPDVIAHTLRTFQGVEHRIEFVRELDGVRYINDSKGTNVDSTIKAIQTMTRPTAIILGGYDKHCDFTPMVQEMLASPYIKEAVLIGATADQIERTCRENDYTHLHRAGTLKDAIDQCRKLSSDGWNVLLSPACASFDMFSDYESRGRIFKELVRELK